MQRRLQGLFGSALALRIGVNTGEVIVGAAREGSSFVTGDAVNVAARLEQAAQPGEILAGERTVAAAQGAFEFGEPTSVAAKGKPDGVVSRRVLRALSLMRPRGVRGLPSVFVGRDAEFAELQARYSQVVVDNEPHLVSIVGDAGVGKTRLMRELWGWLSTESPQPVRRAGRTLSYGQGTTYWPMSEILKEHFSISEDDPPSAVMATLADHPYLGMTMGVAADDDLHPLAARERLHDAWVDFVAGLVDAQPAVMLVEDLHWADDDLFDLIDTLIRQVPGPLLVLGTARPELLDRRPAWGGARGRTSAMRLEALPLGHADSLLTQLLRTEVPPGVREIVVERAEGNPFFVEELVATLIDRGLLARANGGWEFGTIPPGFSLPDSVQAVVAARIDLLPDAEKAALQAAAVIGRTFWSGPLYELLDGAGPDMGLLEEREFVRRRPGSTLPGEREYVIKHALTREVAYRTLPKARRAALHAAFAAWLERRADVRDEMAPLLAHHYARAVKPDDVDLAWAGREQERHSHQASAVTWSRRAAELSVGRYEIDDALTLLRRAIELEPIEAERAELWYQVGHASALKYDGEGFVAAMERALELGAREDRVYAELAYQTSQRAGMWRRRLDDSLVEDWIDRAVAAAPAGTPESVRALVARASWREELGLALEALEAAESLGDDELRSAALGAIHIAYETLGQLGEAWRAAEERIKLLPAITDPDHVAEALLSRADLAVNLGRFDLARTTVDNLEHAVAGLTPHHRVHSLGMLLRLQAAAGDWEAIRAAMDRAEQLVGQNLETPCPFNVAILLIVARAMAEGGERSASERLEAKAVDIGMVGYEEFMAPRWLGLAMARGDFTAMRQNVESAAGRRILAAWEMVSTQLEALALLGDWERIEAEAPRWVQPEGYVAAIAVKVLGMARKSPELLSDAVARFEGMGLEWHAAEAREALEAVGA
jgi:hypothetical protein